MAGRLEDRLTVLLRVVLEEAARNSEFAEALDRALVGDATARDPSAVRETPARPRSARGERRANPDGERTRSARPHRRAEPVLDPFALHDSGGGALRTALAHLSVEQLKDIVAFYGMDRKRLALRWTTSDPLIELIEERVAARARKGAVFLGTSNGTPVRARQMAGGREVWVRLHTSAPGYSRVHQNLLEPQVVAEGVTQTAVVPEEGDWTAFQLVLSPARDEQRVKSLIEHLVHPLKITWEEQS